MEQEQEQSDEGHGVFADEESKAHGLIESNTLNQTDDESECPGLYEDVEIDIQMAAQVDDELERPGLYEVKEENCYIFKPKIVKCLLSLESCKKYNGLKINVKKAHSSEREVSIYDTNKTFEFYLKDDKGNEMELNLMHKDGSSSSKTITIPSLSELAGSKHNSSYNYNINEDIEIEIQMAAQVDHIGTELILKQCLLCQDETNFIKKRKAFSFEAMKKLLGDQAPAYLGSVPTIAVMGSGGGFRAMTAYSGVMTALMDTKILDMVTYNVGLSGSAWYLSTLYSHPEWPTKKSTGDLRSELRNNFKSWPAWNIIKSSYVCSLISDYLSNNFSLTKSYGRFIGNIILKERMNTTLTNQQDKVKEGNVPLPLYAAINVKTTTSAKIFHEWIEFSPYVIGMPKYGAYLPPELFGSEFFLGRVIKKTEKEFPLYFLIGIWGSAYCILLNRFIKDRERNNLVMRSPTVKRVGNDIRGRAAVVNNFMRGLTLQNYQPPKQTSDIGIPSFLKNMFNTTESTERQFEELHEMNPTNADLMYLVDAGLAFNSPYPLILRPERKVNLILSFDFSERESDDADPFSELMLAAKWAKLHKIPFPEITTPEKDEGKWKECYVFENSEDPYCPIVMHFVLINNKFKEFKEPDVRRETEQEKRYADFDVFDHPSKPYSTRAFQYNEKDFNRLADLAEFNTLLNKELIMDNIKKCVGKLKNVHSK